jgi:pyruvate dehydrogenase E2 component (dihydrolipoamide acetyltransferase)
MAEVMKMPLMSDTMTEGTVIAWRKQVGDTVEVGELLLEIETDKAVMEQDSFFEGVLLYIGVNAGDTVPVDSVLCVIGEEGEDPHAAIAAVSGGSAKTAAKVEEPVQASITAVENPTSNEDRVKASPLAKKMAEDAGLSLVSISGSGDHGRIIKRDIEAALEQKTSKIAASHPVQQVVAPVAPTPTPPPPPPAAFGDGQASYEDIVVTGMRKTIARRLGESKFSAPHFYLTIKVNMDNASTIRTQLNEFSPVKISFNDLVVKSAAMALREHPAINSSWLGDHIRVNKVYNVGVAVAVEEGLLVPVIKHADMKSLSQIANEVRVFAGKAKDRKLSANDMSGNTFTISNLGMFGIEEFTAIINSPDACIMAVGAIIDTPVVAGGEIKVAKIMSVTLSCDHRVVDGASGAKFLQTFKAILEDPIRLLV